jgi:hypothetical protein
MDPARALLRHALATVAYRGEKALRAAPPEFGTFSVSPGSRTPVQILAHVGDLFEWGTCLAEGRHVWHDSTPLGWDQEVARFFATLRRFDDVLASEAPLGNQPAQLFQGPVADALTHVGQIMMLRRIAGSPVKGENYFKAQIETGRTGPEQSATRIEFD